LQASQSLYATELAFYFAAADRLQQNGFVLLSQAALTIFVLATDVEPEPSQEERLAVQLIFPLRLT
jgi:hypothetical protein